MIVIGAEEIAKQNAEKNLPTFKEFIKDFHNFSSKGRIGIRFWLGGAVLRANRKCLFESASEDTVFDDTGDIDNDGDKDGDKDDDNDGPNDGAVVRYSCLDCDFPKMDQICPEIENRKGINLRWEYNGYKNTTVDGKPCLNWMQVRPRGNLRTRTVIRKFRGP